MSYSLKMSVEKLFKLDMLKLNMLVIFISLYNPLFAQDKKIDSLKIVIEKAEEDSSKVIALNKLSELIWDSQPDSAIQYALTAKEIGDSIDYKLGVAYALKNAGLGYYIQGEYFEAVGYWQQSLTLFDSINDKGGVSNLLTLLGVIYSIQGDDAKAIDFDSYSEATRFAQTFPKTIPLPDVTVEPDGEIAFEWYRQPRRVFSISIGSRNVITFAGLFGLNKVNGEEYFGDEIPKTILDNLERLYSS